MQLRQRCFGFLRRTFRLYTLTTQNNFTPPLFQILVFKNKKRGGFSMGQRRWRSTVLGYGFSFWGFPSTFTRLAVNISIYVLLRVPKIVLGLPSFSIITAPIDHCDQIFDGIRKVRSLALYALNDPFFCTSLPQRSQRLTTMDLVVDPICTSCYTNSHSNSNSNSNSVEI